ncbi:hypothetical protein [Streptomyces sp. ISL-100]|uniref:hypothetical protein n=1 Tax=Streptomyces sp. ISL-100 TaxID=2819173 RepID=UPI001BECB16B|nr:hypothetical protein [Streptomyces sp. ISL-100]MBT2400475.1 hypothetical protein [Streptomyces sp. ISL-100]
MPRTFHTPVPSGFKFSAATQKLVKKRDDLYHQLSEYKARNADCQPRRSGSVYHHDNPSYVVPAVNAAKRELAELEVQAIAAGKPLPDKDAHMAPVMARVAEYERMTPALRGAYEKASEDVEKAIWKDMPSLASQAMKESDKAQKEYQEAIGKAEAARDKMSGSIDRFLWAVSGTAIKAPMGPGWGGDLEEDATVWEMDGNDRITYECAKALGLITTYSGDLVELREFIAEDDTEEVATPFHSGSRSLGGAAYSANIDGFI